MRRKLLAIASLALGLPLSANALTMPEAPSLANWWSPSRLYMGAYMGYGSVNNMLHNDGQSALGRLAFGVDGYNVRYLNYGADLGLELGLQNGKTMRHAPAENDPDFDVDIPIQTTLNPVLDLLLTVKFSLTPDCRFYGLLKGGMAYRQLQFLDGDFVSSLQQVSGEFQAGIGYVLTKHARATLYYQGIYANGNVKYSQDNTGYVTVSNIPTQQAGFLGLEISL